MSKGTIIYFGNFEMPDRNAAAHRVLNIGKILRDLEYEVCFSGVDKYINCMESKPLEMGEYFYSWPKPYPKNNMEWVSDLTNFDNYRKCIEYFDDVKYILFFDPHAIPLKNTISYCKKHGIKLIADVSEWYENKFSLSFGKFIRWIDTNLVMRNYLKKVDGLISISKYLTKYYSKNISKIATIPPLIDSSEPIWSQKVDDADTSICRFVYAGTTNRTKDKLDTIIEAFSLVKDYQFLLDIYGVTEEQFYVAYPDKKRIMSDISSKVRFYGYVSHNDSIKALLESDCSLIIRDSTRKNNAGFPTKFVEAVTSGIKIIATNVSDIALYKEKCDVLLMDPELLNANQLSNAILAVINNNCRAHSISKVFDYRMWYEDVNSIL